MNKVVFFAAMMTMMGFYGNAVADGGNIPDIELTQPNDEEETGNDDEAKSKLREKLRSVKNRALFGSKLSKLTQSNDEEETGDDDEAKSKLREKLRSVKNRALFGSKLSKLAESDRGE